MSKTEKPHISRFSKNITANVGDIERFGHIYNFAYSVWSFTGRKAKLTINVDESIYKFAVNKLIYYEMDLYVKNAGKLDTSSLYVDGVEVSNAIEYPNSQWPHGSNHYILFIKPEERYSFSDYAANKYPQMLYEDMFLYHCEDILNTIKSDDFLEMATNTGKLFVESSRNNDLKGILTATYAFNVYLGFECRQYFEKMKKEWRRISSKP